ncbi:MAG TPA: glycosyltransferase family 2 protein [Thermoanaerobaculia bacterium]|nr:glycosyltransferase family 2 protein [Thermoanaerobaculia bacterium]
MSVTVLIAARNEERWVAASVRSAFDAGAGEVIVVDAESIDRTREIARDGGATVIECEPMRARQFNRGAAVARGDAIIFLHGDTVLPPGAAAAVEAALQRYDFGGFRIAFAEDSLKLRLAAFLINLRTRITRAPWGDQAQFVHRGTAFREMPLMEDYELAVRMKRRVLLPLAVTTSGRRFLEKGLIRTAVLNWAIILAWRFGVSAKTLARWY